MNLIIICLILIPLILSNVLHMLVVKLDRPKTLKIPINEPLFGSNKTWRGVLIVSIFNMIIMGTVNIVLGVTSLPFSFFAGLLCGLAYVIAELPNSYLKRRIGIDPGKQPNKHKWLFMLIDKSDSALGVTLVAGLMFHFKPLEMLLFFIISVLVHIFFSIILVGVGIKKSF